MIYGSEPPSSAEEYDKRIAMMAGSMERMGRQLLQIQRIESTANAVAIPRPAPVNVYALPKVSKAA